MGTAQKPGTPTANPSATAAIEQRAREFLAAGRYRKAREEIKALCKLDRPKYLPWLIEANQGLVKEMLSKGQVSEAQQVIAYLKTIAPAAQVRALEVDVAVKANDSAALLRHALPTLSDAHAALPEAEKRRLADQLVIAFAPLPTSGADGARLGEEVAAIQAALAALAQGQFERVPAELQRVPHGSVLSHWKLFLKGLTAFYTGQGDKAERCFAGLPAGSIPARASQSFRLLLGTTVAAGANAPSGSAVLDGACRIAGLSGLGGLLQQADQLWRQNRPRASYLLLRNRLAGFPSDQLDLLGALSDFYFKAIFGLSEEAAGDYARAFDDQDYRGDYHGPAERALTLRMLALFDEGWEDTPHFRQLWEGFLHAHEQRHGAQPRLASLVFERLGSLCATPRAPGPFEYRRQVALRDSAGAIAALTKSVTLNPANLTAHLALCQVYEILKMTSERNHLLDAMTERFPHEKAVLFQAGRLCLERKAYVKGLDYLESAFALDRLDPRVPDLMVWAKFQLALQAYAKPRLDKARQLIQESAAHWVDQAANLARARWCLLTRQALCEYRYGDRQLAQSLLAAARAASPAAVAFLLFAECAARLVAPEQEWPFDFEGEWVAAAKTAHAREAVLLLRIYLYWSTGAELKGFDMEEEWLQAYLERAVTQPFNRAEAGLLMALAGPDSVFAPQLLPFVEKILRQDPQDPLFRLYRYALEPFALTSADDRVDAIQSILEEAVRRGDDQTAQVARLHLARLQAARAPAPMPEEFEVAPPEEEEEFEPPGPPEETTPPASEEEVEVLQNIVRMLANATKGEVDHFRRNLPKEIPRELFDLLLATARRGGKLPPILPTFAPPAPAKPGPAFKPVSAPKSDPNQLEFF